MCDLNRFILDYKLNNSKILKILISITKGLKYLHDRKIIHGDIKSSNILVFNDLKIKICDFSLSSVFPYQKMISTSIYRAPEVVKSFLLEKSGKKSIKWNKESDIWSLGCVLFDLKFRIHLFKKKDEIKDYITSYNEWDKFTKINNIEKYKKNSYFNLPRIFNKNNNIERLILKMLKVNPLKRLNCDEILKMLKVTKYNLTNENINNEKISRYYLRILNSIKNKEKEIIKELYSIDNLRKVNNIFYRKKIYNLILSLVYILLNSLKYKIGFNIKTQTCIWIISKLILGEHPNIYYYNISKIRKEEGKIYEILKFNFNFIFDYLKICNFDYY